MSGNWTTRNGRHVVRHGSGGPGKTREMRNDWLTVSGGKIGIETGIGHQLGDALENPCLFSKARSETVASGGIFYPRQSPSRSRDNRQEVRKGDYLGHPAHNDEVRHASWTKGEIPAPPKHTWHAGLQYLGDAPGPRRCSRTWASITRMQRSTKSPVSWWQGDKDRYNAAMQRCTGKPQSTFQGSPKRV